jgi:hypothetical protein
MTEETAAVDIDDVVVKHVEGFIAWSNENYGTTLRVEDYSEAWHELWSISKDEEEERKKLFFVDEVIGAFEVIEGASEGLVALASVKRVVGVTSRRESLRQVTETVLQELAPGAFSEVVFATSIEHGVKRTRSKADICKEIGARSLVDDHHKHCLAVNEVGIRAVLFGEYPWNQTEEALPPGIVRAADWKETLAIYGIDNHRLFADRTVQ